MNKPDIIATLNGPNLVPYPVWAEELSPITKDRVRVALEAAAHDDVELIAMIGRGARAMARHGADLLEEADGPYRRLLIEDESYDSVTNAHFTKELLEELGLGNVHVVTSDYHLPRTRNIWHKVFGDDYQLTFEAARTDMSPKERMTRQLKETLFGLYDDAFIFSTMGFYPVRAADDGRREDHLRTRHPRSSESIWRSLGLGGLADRIS